jgi:phosphatidylglycerophosphate synthase
MAADSLTEGERWTLAELARLRAGGWRPRAWRDFLWAAQVRATVTRQRRPALARQEVAWIATGAAAWLAAGRLLPAGSSLAQARRRGLIWWAVTAVMLDWHLGMLETPDGRAVGLGAADALTLVRAWLAPAVAERADPILLVIGGLTDLADGRVARATRCTRFGRDLEGVVDACFAAAALRGAARSKGVSSVTVRVERARSLAGAAYVSMAYLLAGRPPDQAVRRSGRRAAPVRLAGLVAAGAGRRELADRLLLAATLIAVTGLLRQPGDARTEVAAAAGAR